MGREAGVRAEREEAPDWCPGGVRRSFEAMGIGGLDQEFSDIFRRAFASRIFPVSVMKKLGISHVKGTALHGPPGTGKAPSPHSRGCGQA